MPTYSTGFKLGLVDRIRGTYLDHRKSTITWNHDDREKVGGSSVATVKVSLVPRLSRGRRKRAWYTLFVHVLN